MKDAEILEMADQAGLKIDPRFGECYTGNVQLIAFARLIEQKAKQKTPALERFMALGADEETDPIERLRFFCSKAMDGRDWLDVEPFIDAVAAIEAATREEDIAVARDFVQYISDWDKADECAAAIRNSGGAA
jgi:hypothetical protein